jgi:hypothetical protein
VKKRLELCILATLVIVLVPLTVTIPSRLISPAPKGYRPRQASSNIIPIRACYDERDKTAYKHVIGFYVNGRCVPTAEYNRMYPPKPDRRPTSEEWVQIGNDFHRDPESVLQGHPRPMASDDVHQFYERAGDVRDYVSNGDGSVTVRYLDGSSRRTTCDFSAKPFFVCR